MLALTRKPGEKIHIGNNIVITVVEIHGNRVRISIEAPDDVRILRGELACWQEETVHDLDPELPISNVRSMEDWVSGSAAQPC